MSRTTRPLASFLCAALLLGPAAPGARAAAALRSSSGVPLRAAPIGAPSAAADSARLSISPSLDGLALDSSLALPANAPPMAVQPASFPLAEQALSAEPPAPVRRAEPSAASEPPSTKPEPAPQERVRPASAGLAKTEKALRSDSGSAPALLLGLFDAGRQANPSLRVGDVSAAEIDSTLAGDIAAGRAYVAYQGSHAAKPLEGDVPIALDPAAVRAAKAAMIRAADDLRVLPEDAPMEPAPSSVVDDVFAGMDSPGIAPSLADVRVVVLRGRGLLYKRDPLNHQALHAGRARRTIYVGELLWERLLADGPAMAGLLAPELYHLRHPDAPEERAETEALLLERRADPSGRLRRLVLELSGDEPPVRLLGPGDASRAFPLLVAEAVRGRAIDLRAEFDGRWSELLPELARAWKEEGLALEDEERLIRERLKPIHDDLRRLTPSPVPSANVADYLFLEVARKASRYEDRLRAIGARQAGIEAEKRRAFWIQSHLDREASEADEFNAAGRGALSADEYAELLGAELALLEDSPYPGARALLSRELDAVHSGLARRLGKDPVAAWVSARAVRVSDREQRDFLGALGARLGVPVGLHDGRELFADPRAAILALGFETQPGRGAVSIHADVLRHWLARPAGRDPEALADLLADALRAPALSSRASALLASGAEGLARAYYEAHPSLDQAYRSAKRSNRLLWAAWSLLLAAVIVADVLLAHVAPIDFAVHLVGYIGILVADQWGPLEDWRYFFHARRRLGDAEKPRMPLGLRPLIERSARRAGFRLRHVDVSDVPEARALAVRVDEIPGRGGPAAVDVVLPRALLERTFLLGESAKLQAAVAQALAHSAHRSRTLIAVASVGVTHLLDLALSAVFPGIGALHPAAYLLGLAVSYVVGRRLFRGQELYADLEAARLTGDPAALARHLEESEEDVRQGRLPVPRFAFVLPRGPNSDERARRLRELSE
ncbi:MAG TPA: hypothetical protein VNI01_05555 [Elusimicrobiota bacterium]|nr:hypothetical protein [Elusimicrobiota bacterium]